MVNHQEQQIPMRDGSFMTIKRGQHLTSVRAIARAVGWYENTKWDEPNPKSVKNVLDWLVNQQMIQIDNGENGKKYTLVTILSWDKYQQTENSDNNKSSVWGNTKETGESHTGEGIQNQKGVSSNTRETQGKQSADINKNVKNDKNYKDDDKEDAHNAHRFYQENFGVLNPFMSQSISAWCEDLDDEIVIAAMKLTLSNNTRSFKYTEAILKDWVSLNLKSIHAIRSHEKQKAEKKKSNVVHPKSNHWRRKDVRRDKMPKWYEEEEQNGQAPPTPKSNETAQPEKSFTDLLEERKKRKEQGVMT